MQLILTVQIACFKQKLAMELAEKIEQAAESVLEDFTSEHPTPMTMRTWISKERKK